MRYLFLFSLFFGAATQLSFAQARVQEPPAKNKFHFNLAEGQDTVAGYAQALRVGNTIYVSGTVSTLKTEKGVAQVYATIRQTLAHYGATLQHIVKENLYTTDIEQMKSLNHIRKQYYKGDYPAATWVQISRLYMEEAWLEVEVVAVLPDGSK